MPYVLLRKWCSFALIAAAALMLSVGAAFALDEDEGEDVEDVSVFYEELQDYGHWVTHPEWGYVWIPDDVDDEWRPYTRGYWSYTEEYGWYWVSDEPWGWIVYHYGRWGYDEDLGWFWVPGTKWGPAWVVWRWSEDYVGWAALPPDAIYEEDGDIEFRSSFYDSPRYIPLWVFVEPEFLIVPHMHRHIRHWRHNRAIYFRTRPVTRYGRHDHRVFNRGIERREIERLTRRRIPTAHIVIGRDRPRPGAGTGGPGTINIYRPRLKRPDHAIDPRTLGKREGAEPKFRREGRRGPNLLAPEGGVGTPRSGTGTPTPKPGPKLEVVPRDGAKDKDKDKTDTGKDQPPTGDYTVRRRDSGPPPSPEGLKKLPGPQGTVPPGTQPKPGQYQQYQKELQQQQQQRLQQRSVEPRVLNRPPQPGGQPQVIVPKPQPRPGDTGSGQPRTKRDQKDENQPPR